MTYNVRPLSCDPKKLKGLSERLIVSHWENNYGGAVKRLNAITAPARWPGFRDTARLRHQRLEARRTDRDELHDPA
jgi:hypothetical protein